MKHRSLEEYLRQFELTSTPDMGGVVWKHHDDLQMGVIIGKDLWGEKYVIYNQSSLKIFALQPLKEFESGKYCYLDFNRQFHNRHKIAMLAFDLLYQYNEYNNNYYPNDFKFELPTDDEVEIAQTQEFSRGLSSVVYRASLLHVLEEKMKIGIQSSNLSLRKGLSDFARQFKESLISTPIANLKTTKIS